MLHILYYVVIIIIISIQIYFYTSNIKKLYISYPQMISVHFVWSLLCTNIYTCIYVYIIFIYFIIIFILYFVVLCSHYPCIIKGLLYIMNIILYILYFMYVLIVDVLYTGQYVRII